MSVKLFVHPNPGQSVPKVWGYRPVGAHFEVFWGSVNKTWQSKPQSRDKALKTEDEKVRGGYVLVGSFSSYDKARRVCDCWPNRQSYAYDPKDNDARLVALAYQQLGFSPQQVATPKAQPPAPPAAKPAPRRKAEFFKQIDAQVKTGDDGFELSF
ncbi:hypothetical protein [Methylibium petroleiphilum]|uniref:Uncharacterized protein n=1 Tax=Methylibium petroleiphilum (strain ATCC BAA-1232 / LMG 22953 / PM1) TaxID=420662 RepID=A2SNN1_METPP|nr:hypothetical protein [Methylibium petroleiphilum]ABM97170.1 hypothetical protein Mpe_B0395 [Methylibium petroleiphilum PM1]